jgi:D-alanyl-D-alanine carboxypeptidase
MTQKEIMRMQTKLGVVADGFWGPKSIAACQAYLRSLMPKPNPFPAQDNVTAFYGKHGEPGGFSPPTKTIVLPFPIFYEGQKVTKLSPHEKCADSLLRVFERLAIAFPTEEARRAAGLLAYDGLYNPRKMRGGTSWSMHSWAIAVDFNAGKNGNKTAWPSIAVMPLEVMECFAREGWTSAGAFWGRDAMHFQATKPD